MRHQEAQFFGTEVGYSMMVSWGVSQMRIPLPHAERLDEMTAEKLICLSPASS
jgi:hypothetical protein